jgi:hypothetical protein
MSDWQRLSVRDGRASDDGPYEGVPRHLYQPLRDWIDSWLGGTPGSWSDANGGPRLAAAIRVDVVPPRGHKLTVRLVTEALYTQPDLMLDALDAALHLNQPLSGLDIAEMRLSDLDEILSLGGSVWRVDPNGHRLIRRVAATAQADFENASSPDDMASAELQEAWTAVYGRNPDPSDAWDHSIKAVEAALIPVVVPRKDKATLGDVVGSLNARVSQWELSLHGHDDSRSAAPLVAMLRLMWPNPDRHSSGNSRKPSLDEAQAVVSLAVTVVQWVRAGVLSSR